MLTAAEASFLPPVPHPVSHPRDTEVFGSALPGLMGEAGSGGMQPGTLHPLSLSWAHLGIQTSWQAW